MYWDRDAKKTLKNNEKYPNLALQQKLELSRSINMNGELGRALFQRKMEHEPLDRHVGSKPEL